MKNSFLEFTPVEYSPAATKTLSFNIPPHSSCFRLHWHDRIELLRVKKGKLYVEDGKNLSVVSEGEMIIIPPKTLHRGYTLEVNADYNVLMFDIRSFYNETEICKRIFPDIFEGKIVFNTIVSNPEIIDCIDSICSIGNNGSLNSVYKTYQLLSLFFEKEILEYQTNPGNKIVKKIIHYLEKNAVQEITISTLCNQFGYTSAHICRIFRQATGLPPMTYLKFFRLEMAHNKIKTCDASISDIAAMCGFSDANYFARCFKSHFGVSPTQYRKLYSNKTHSDT